MKKLWNSFTTWINQLRIQAQAHAQALALLTQTQPDKYLYIYPDNKEFADLYKASAIAYNAFSYKDRPVGFILYTAGVTQTQPQTQIGFNHSMRCSAYARIKDSDVSVDIYAIPISPQATIACKSAVLVSAGIIKMPIKQPVVHKSIHYKLVSSLANQRPWKEIIVIWEQRPSYIMVSTRTQTQPELELCSESESESELQSGQLLNSSD
jgi:hypothetical protein